MKNIAKRPRAERQNAKRPGRAKHVASCSKCSQYNVDAGKRAVGMAYCRASSALFTQRFNSTIGLPQTSKGEQLLSNLKLSNLKRITRE